VSFSLKNRGEEGFASLKPEAAPRIKLEEKRGTENIFGDETTLTADDEHARRLLSLSLKK
jgi:hypothetical protein